MRRMLLKLTLFRLRVQTPFFMHSIAYFIETYTGRSDHMTCGALRSMRHATHVSSHGGHRCDTSSVENGKMCCWYEHGFSDEKHHYPSPFHAPEVLWHTEGRAHCGKLSCGCMRLWVLHNECIRRNFSFVSILVALGV